VEVQFFPRVPTIQHNVYPANCKLVGIIERNMLQMFIKYNNYLFTVAALKDINSNYEFKKLVPSKKRRKKKIPDILKQEISYTRKRPSNSSSEFGLSI
jgi:hypothetical protein